ncbi:50S ribosomal protein L24 [Actinomadura decatromicini]|uniref:Large ribosomal subunit protein uL24 n=1 Tax=Actinomadura decatromicini TaxID=2604572 RepID=A0A5D3FHF0_9ACTN|nr:50S ribosomal protein L24 [Actinomadura decatromicini]
MKIRKGDEVIVLAGKDRGATGKVLRVIPREDRVVVEGVNLITKNIKADQQRAGKESGRVTVEAPLHVSNVALAENGQPVRIGYEFDEDGNKVRVTRPHKSRAKASGKASKAKSSAKPAKAAKPAEPAESDESAEAAKEPASDD